MAKGLAQTNVALRKRIEEAEGEIVRLLRENDVMKRHLAARSRLRSEMFLIKAVGAKLSEDAAQLGRRLATVADRFGGK